MPTLMVVLASTRPGRVGLPVWEWFCELAEAHGGFTLDRVDLKELDLPFMDEPNHPRLRNYIHDHTKAWSARVDAADAFVFVTPEYNHGINAPLKNAIDYLHNEWSYKALGLVSYGGVSAGTRAAIEIRTSTNPLKLVTIPETVSIPFVAQFIEDGQVEANEIMEKSAKTMLNELARWTTALATLRTER